MDTRLTSLHDYLPILILADQAGQILQYPHPRVALPGAPASGHLLILHVGRPSQLLPALPRACLLLEPPELQTSRESCSSLPPAGASGAEHLQTGVCANPPLELVLHLKPPPAAALSARNTAAIAPDTDTGFKLSRKNKLISRRIMKDSSLFTELNCYQHNSNSPPILIPVAAASHL